MNSTTYNKRIVLDYDDTLAFHKNRDFNNAKPNIPLIKKINKMYESGWIIDIFTARGSISCETRKEADKKYRNDMENWLKKHEVKYNQLSFDKPLAAYYIDDKGIHPDDFLKTDIRPLIGGLSGSDIYTDGKFVHKTDNNAHEVRKWFDKVKEYLNIPKIDRVIGNTITMEYIEHDKGFFNNNPFVAIGLIQQTLEQMKHEELSHKYGWDSYVDRINEHASNASYPDDWNKIVSSLSQMSLKESFSHGDFGITNFLFSENNLYIIDPIPNMFGCVELDAAKFVASLYVNSYDKKYIDYAFSAMIAYNKMLPNEFKHLIASQLIRIYKYHPNKEFIKECVNESYFYNY